MSKETGGSAFPSPGVVRLRGFIGKKQEGAYEGMTLRDYFAAKALQGMYSDPHTVDRFEVGVISDQAYRIADAMLVARAK